MFYRLFDNARRATVDSLDWAHRAATGNSGVPRWSMRAAVGSGSLREFTALGKSYLDHMRRLADLTPFDRVFDLGCGVGRMAIPLAGFLDPRRGSYEGIDVDRRLVGWCQANLEPKHPNFRFRTADVYNKMYNPQGRTMAHEYVFPFPDRAFSFALAGSLFTHLRPQDCERYLSETARVLEPGGRGLLTWFLLNDAQAAREREGKSLERLPHAEGVARYKDAVLPELMVAYPEAWLRDACAKHGLSIRAIHPGRWSGHADALEWQDLVVVERAADARALAPSA